MFKMMTMMMMMMMILIIILMHCIIRGDQYLHGVTSINKCRRVCVNVGVYLCMWA